jgi:regulatory protein
LDEDAAREKCLRLLAVRGRSEAELRGRLRDSGFAEPLIEKVLSRLADAGLVDDEEFARSWVGSRRSAGGTGRRKLRWELRRKGVSEELIRRFVDEVIDDETELESALELARRRLRGRPPDAKELARLRRLLLGRGFGYDTVESVLRHIMVEAEH